MRRGYSPGFAACPRGIFAGSSRTERQYVFFLLLLQQGMYVGALFLQDGLPDSEGVFDCDSQFTILSLSSFDGPQL